MKKVLTERIMTIEDFQRKAEPCNLFQRVQRELEVADLKDVYPREYLLKAGLCTAQEYETACRDFPENEREKALRTANDVARIMHCVVGYEI